MLIQIKRIANGPDSTIGFMTIDGKFICFTLEDQYQEIKVRHETRIPAGVYQIKFREEPSPMTQRYRQRYDWFNWHLQIMDVPNFSNVYIHVGNTDDHTSGCILAGLGAVKEGQDYRVIESAKAFRKVYAQVSRALNAGDKVTLEITTA